MMKLKKLQSINYKNVLFELVNLGIIIFNLIKYYYNNILL
jgi:hypothetical protein